jgi:hypothetical protein
MVIAHPARRCNQKGRAVGESLQRRAGALSRAAADPEAAALVEYCEYWKNNQQITDESGRIVPAAATIVPCLLLSTLVAAASPAQADSGLDDLLDGIEARVGQRPELLQRHDEFLRLGFSTAGAPLVVEVTYSRSPSAWSTRHYRVQPGPQSQVPEALLRRVLAAVQAFDSGPDHQALVARQRGPRPARGEPPAGSRPPGVGQDPQDLAGVYWYPGRQARARSWLGRLTSEPTPWLQLALLLALLLLACRAGAIRTRLRAIARPTWLVLAAITAAGLVLRLGFGVRVPGFISGHGLGGGFKNLNDLLISAPGGAEPHGNAYQALFDLVTAVLPAHETTVIAVQIGLSALVIPLTFALGRLWLGEERPSLWAAVVVALMPVCAYFAATEVRTVAGSFFAMLSLVTIELARRDGRLVTMISAALLTAVATQFHPVLYGLPMAAAVLVLSRRQTRALLVRAPTWVAIAVFLLVMLGTTAATVSTWSWQENSILGAGFFAEPPAPSLLLAWDFTLDASDGGNLLLYSDLTPPLLPILAACGLAFAIHARRWFVFAILAAALALTWPGLAAGRLNLGRLQLAAQPLWAILAAYGLHRVASLWRPGRRWSRWLPQALAGGLLLASLALWPGPLLRRPTPVVERELVLRALPRLEAGCRVIIAPESDGPNWTLPAYLDQQDRARLRWGTLEETSVPENLLSVAPCCYYYRSAACYAVRENEHRARPLRRCCERVEDQLALEAAHVELHPAVPDGMISYSLDELEIGFFRIVGLE